MRLEFDVCAVCGFAQTVYFARAKKLHSAFASVLQIWNGSLFGLSLATNVVVTVLIALRVWYACSLSSSDFAADFDRAGA